MRHFIIILTLAAAMAACDNKPGPDSITAHGLPVLNDCLTCHGPGSTVAPDPLATNGSGTAGKHVAHASTSGSGLPCERCHYGYLNNPNHGNGVVDTASAGASPVVFDPLNSVPSSTPPPPATFTYVTGPPAAGNCSNVRCHVDAAGTPTTMDWYGPDVPFVLPACDRCHNVPIGIRRQVLGAAGDFASNPSVTSHHVNGADPTTAQCKLCHDQYHHMAGTVQLHHMTTGTRVTYDAAAPATLETFCLGCHNASGATFTFMAGGSPLDPFNDGTSIGTLPYVASTSIASSWTGSSTHRSRGVTCIGSPTTGCHGRGGSANAHGSMVKGLLTNTMNFQIPLVSQSVYTANPLGSSDYANNYKLCFDCHANYPLVTKEVVLGYRQTGPYNKTTSPTPYFTSGIRSLFRDRYVGVDPLRPYSDTIGGDAYLALHNYHLIGFEANALAPIVADRDKNMLQWKYRGDPARIGRITCTACHNVHGTVATTVRSTHQELGLVQDYYRIAFGFLSQPGESYTSLDSLIDETIMMSHPMNCAISCHQAPSGIQSQSYWHTPGGD